ncbi:hypothetical protein BGW38_006456 [Lunasporangiospora selenospora]|uniref:Uncharacterized protein n=1 Tax=Lunasporangiospora selenospora TaxID=979761 RepID=A0A9P6KG85_9FUNG|nr:hypothetical protein BGW38_006456 [Lunasporangiospora selenospora]
MIEVDVFWSFSFGAIFAAASAGTLKTEERFWSTPSFVYTLLFLSLIFAPSGLYLLWDNPGWESMFVLGDKNEIHAILPTVFAFTNVLLGIIGYYVTYRKIRSNRHEEVLPMSHNKYWIHAYTCFCAILGMGYNRFMYPSDYVAWRAGTEYPLTDFFTSRILYTLLAMGVVLIPAAYIPCYIWFKNQTLLRHGDKSRLIITCLYFALQGVWVISAVFGGYQIRNFVKDPQLSYVENMWRLFDSGDILNRNSKWSPLLGFWVAELLVMFLVALPVFFIPSVPAKKTIKTQ